MLLLLVGSLLVPSLNLVTDTTLPTSLTSDIRPSSVWLPIEACLGSLHSMFHAVVQSWVLRVVQDSLARQVMSVTVTQTCWLSVLHSVWSTVLHCLSITVEHWDGRVKHYVTGILLFGARKDH